MPRLTLPLLSNIDKQSRRVLNGNNGSLQAKKGKKGEWLYSRRFQITSSFHPHSVIVVNGPTHSSSRSITREQIIFSPSEYSIFLSQFLEKILGLHQSLLFRRRHVIGFFWGAFWHTSTQSLQIPPFVSHT